MLKAQGLVLIPKYRCYLFNMHQHDNKLYQPPVQLHTNIMSLNSACGTAETIAHELLPLINEQPTLRNGSFTAGLEEVRNTSFHQIYTIHLDAHAQRIAAGQKWPSSKFDDCSQTCVYAAKTCLTRMIRPIPFTKPTLDRSVLS